MSPSHLKTDQTVWCQVSNRLQGSLIQKPTQRLILNSRKRNSLQAKGMENMEEFEWTAIPITPLLRV